MYNPWQFLEENVLYEVIKKTKRTNIPEFLIVEHLWFCVNEPFEMNKWSLKSVLELKAEVVNCLTHRVGIVGWMFKNQNQLIWKIVVIFWILTVVVKCWMTLKINFS